MLFRSDRRARLIARVCKGAKVTLADARESGYCDAGISAWRSARGLTHATSIDLPALARDANPLAIKLALRLARKLAAESRQRQYA